MTQPMNLKKKLSDLLPHIITAAVMAAVFVGLFFLNIQDRSRDTIRNLNVQLGMTAERIENAFNSELGIAGRLASIVARKPTITASELDAFTFAMLTSDTSVTSVSAAPNAIVAWYYPRVSGQSLIGHDLLSNPERRRSVVDSIDKKTPVASGPSDSLDGGLSVYVRSAVFTSDRKTEKLWGVISVAADFGKLMKKVGIKDDTGTVRFALSGPDAQNPSVKTVFWGRREILSGNPRKMQVNLPGLVWELAAVPSAGWRNALPADYLVLVAGLAACVAIIMAGLFSRTDEVPSGIDVADAADLLDSVSTEIRAALVPVAGFLETADSPGAGQPVTAPVLPSGSAVAGSGEKAVDPYRTVAAARHSFRMLRRLSSDIRETISLERPDSTHESIEFDIRSIISGLAAEFAEKIALKGIVLQTSVEAVIPQSIFGDPVRLGSVLYNLLGESVAYTEKGEVTLSVILEDTVKNGVVLRFIVRDTGSVPDPDKLAGIFEAFSSSRGLPSKRFATTGLAMSLAGSLVRLLGGHLEYEPGSGQGFMVRFTLRFSLIPEDEASLQSETRQSSIPGDGQDRNGQDHVSDEIGKPVVMQNPDSSKKIATHGSAASKSKENTPKRSLLGFMRNGAKKRNTQPALSGQKEPAGESAVFTVPEIREREGCPDTAAESANQRSANIQPDMSASVISRNTVNDSSRMSVSDGLKEAGYRPVSEFGNMTIPFAPRILLAEDGEVNREIIMRMLKSRSYTADIATDGRQALAACLRNEYDIVFMDCIMPVMDGYESSARMRQLKGPGRPVIIGMTSSVKESERERCFAAGMDDVISKPFTLDELVASIRKHSETD